MDIKTQIDKAISRLIIADYKNSNAIDKEKKCEEIYAQYHAGKFDFSKLCNMTLNQGDKKRTVKYYNDIYSVENVLCQCIKQILDRNFKVRYPNRNKVMRSLFSYVSAVKQMSHFVIVKFDFKDYYNSVSTSYVFEKYIKNKIFNRDELKLIQEFVSKTQYAYAGLPTSNIIAEIIALDFDDSIKHEFIDDGLLFYERYIDDCILILNDNCAIKQIEEKLDKVLNTTYNTVLNNKILPCKVKFNKEKKFQYISKNNLDCTPTKIDYLGYEFIFNLNSERNIVVKYGITEEKRKKYAKKLAKIIQLYKNAEGEDDYQKKELLRQRIKAFSTRTVYISKRYNSNVWKAKGFIVNYGELRYYLDTDAIDEDTKNFLKNMVKDAFNKADIDEPYFLKQSGYNLFDNMKVNKTLLLVQNIGYSYDSLINVCKKIGIEFKEKNKRNLNYNKLVKEYLIKLKVGY